MFTFCLSILVVGDDRNILKRFVAGKEITLMWVKYGMVSYLDKVVIFVQIESDRYVIFKTREFYYSLYSYEFKLFFICFSVSPMIYCIKCMRLYSNAHSCDCVMYTFVRCILHHNNIIIFTKINIFHFKHMRSIDAWFNLAFDLGYSYWSAPCYYLSVSPFFLRRWFRSVSKFTLWVVSMVLLSYMVCNQHANYFIQCHVVLCCIYVYLH